MTCTQHPRSCTLTPDQETTTAQENERAHKALSNHFLANGADACYRELMLEAKRTQTVERTTSDHLWTFHFKEMEEYYGN